MREVAALSVGKLKYLQRMMVIERAKEDLRNLRVTHSADVKKYERQLQNVISEMSTPPDVTKKAKGKKAGQDTPDMIQAKLNALRGYSQRDHRY